MIVTEVIFIKIKNNFLKIIMLILLIIPLNTFAYSKYIVPGGETIGIEVNSKGVFVIGFYEVDGKFIAKEAGFKIGDIITAVDDTPTVTIDEMVTAINNSQSNQIKFNVLRDGKEREVNLKLKSETVLKTGLYVKDKISGVGTLTYIDPSSNIFGSLGHEILESKTASKFEIKDGKIYEASVSSINKSKAGLAGEKNAIYNKEKIYGSINENDTTGIYGTYTHNINKDNLIEVGEEKTITTGPAIIRTVINDNNVEEFDIEILRLNSDSKTKNILFEITDKDLLEKSGGIIQGMSGSPIIQNNKIVGAVNYVIVNEPKKGYGIFITTMLKEGEN